MIDMRAVIEDAGRRWLFWFTVALVVLGVVLLAAIATTP